MARMLNMAKRHAQERVLAGRRAFAMLEYVMLVIIVVFGLLSFSTYLRRGFQGQYRKVGTSIGFGRQFAAHGTLDCVNDGGWFSQACFDNEVVARKCSRVADYDACISGVKSACTAGCP